MGFTEQLLDYNLCKDYSTCVQIDSSEYLLSHLSTFQPGVSTVALRWDQGFWAV